MLILFKRVKELFQAKVEDQGLMSNRFLINV